MAPWSFDALIGCVLVLAASWGAQRGLMRQLVWPLSWAAGLTVGTHHGSTFAEFVEISAPWNQMVAGLAVGFGGFVAARVLLGNMAKVTEQRKSRQADQLFGAVLGAGKGAVLIMVVTVCGLLLLPEQMLPRDSYAVSLTQQALARSHALLSPDWQQNLQPWFALVLEQ